MNLPYTGKHYVLKLSVKNIKKKNNTLNTIHTCNCNFDKLIWHILLGMSRFWITYLSQLRQWTDYGSVWRYFFHISAVWVVILLVKENKWNAAFVPCNPDNQQSLNKHYWSISLFVFVAYHIVSHYCMSLQWLSFFVK